MKDYSQNGEQAAILNALEGWVLHGQTGRFLDIGAFDPETFSNTRALFELGWKGVLVEPSPAPLRALIEKYGDEPEMAIVGACVSVEDGLLAEIMITDDAVSTTEAANLRQWINHAKFIGKLYSPMVTIPDLINRFGRFDFVNIDTEGTSVDLLKVLVAMEMFPQCICVEHDGRIVEASEAAHKRGYKTVATNQANLIFAL